jgi:hypothetical protein
MVDILKTLITTSLFAIFMTTIGSACSKENEALVVENISKIIQELSGQWGKAMLEKDPTILERIWAPEFVYVESSGRKFTKEQGIEDLKNGKEKLDSAVASSIHVRVFGGGTVAVDIGDYREVGKDKNGKTFDRMTRFTNVWVLKNGKWQCVNGHCSDLKTKP